MPKRDILEMIRDDGSITNDSKEILYKWYSDFSKCFSSLQDNSDVAFDDKFYDKICTLKSEFELLSLEEQRNECAYDVSSLNCDISIDEVSKAVDKLKNGKSFLDIPNEALKSNSAKAILCSFFNQCFKHGLSPYDWDKSDILPIKKADKDERVPLNNRPICIQDCVAKLYCSVLNNRIQNHLNINNIILEEQYGFQALKSCLDHVFSLVTILRNRKQHGLSTYLCFVDFRSAFTTVNTNLLQFKLFKIGIIAPGE